MSSNPMEYQIPSGNYTSESPQSTGVIRNEISSIYSNSNVIDFSMYRERKSEAKKSEYSETMLVINSEIDDARKKYLDSSYFATSEGSVIRAIAKKVAKMNKLRKTRPLTEEDLIKKESSEVGSIIFGDVLPNEHREFFKDSQGDWFFYQEFMNAKGVSRSVTLHYEILPAGILCINSESGIKGEFIEGKHLKDFMDATQTYHDLVIEKYKINSQTGKKVA